MRRSLVPALFATLLCLSLCVAGQEITGTIVGTVTDQTGAVLPDATVVVTNTDRNAVIRTLTTNQSGEYVAALLPVGHYSVAVSHQGFRTLNKSGIEVNVNDRLTIDAQLPAGAASEVVDVKAEALQVDTQTATAQGLINGIQIRELALSARNYEEMVALTPGVSSNVADTIFVGAETPGGDSNQVSFSINGTRFSQNNWTIDGADNVDRGGNFTLLNFPSVDAITEFKVLRSQYDAEYGRGAGGQISVLTRSGTSQFHGGMYEFFRNDALDANRYLNKHVDPILPRPTLRYNDFGWTLGGPVYIPGHFNKDKNKTFFFYSEELRRIVTVSTKLVTVPNQAERNGFSCVGDTTCSTAVSGINPAAQAYITDIFNKLPLPQDPGADQLTITGANRFNYRQEIVRIDHTFNDRLAITGRWMNDNIPTINPAGLFDASDVLGYATTNTNSPGRNLLIRGTIAISPKLLNEVGYAWSYGAILSTPIGLSTIANSPNVAAAITLPSPSPLPRIPNLVFDSGSSFNSFGQYDDVSRNHNVFDNLTWVKGHHTMKYGFTYHRYQKNENDAGFDPSTGSFEFGAPDFHQAWVDFLQGNVTTFNQFNTDFHARIRQHTLEFYGQDEYRVRPNLTLTLGLRYTHYAQATDAGNQASSFYAPFFNAAQAPPVNADGTICLSGGACDAGLTPNPNYNPLNGVIVSSNNTSAIAKGAHASPFGSAVAQTNTLDFAPRLGFSWDPFNSGKTAVRGGFGIFFDAPAIGYLENNEFVNPPFVNNFTIGNTVLDNPGSVSPGVNSSAVFVKGVDPNWHLPYTEAWSLDVQRELPHGIVVDVGYYGNHGVHLLGLVDVNQPAPGAVYSLAGVTPPITRDNFGAVNQVRPFQGYGPIYEYLTGFSSNYHGLQASLQKRFGSNSLIALNYTWSHALTNLGNDGASPQNNSDIRAEYGPADFDRRHIFTADFVYAFPWLRQQRGLAGHLLGGWEFSGIITYNSGLFLTPLGTIKGVDPAGLGLLDPNASTNDQLTFAPPLRPDQVGSPNAAGTCANGARVGTADCWFNTNAFADPPDGVIRPGNARRGSIRGPGIERWDLSLFKNIRMTERLGMQFRVETFNVFNHTNFQGIDTTVSSSTYGQVTSIHEPRIMQLGLKLNF